VKRQVLQPVVLRAGWGAKARECEQRRPYEQKKVQKQVQVQHQVTQQQAPAAA
jgi:hypothetical protein